MSESTTSHPGGRGLWLAAGAGILLWAVHLTGMAALTPWACEVGAAWPFHALTVLTLVPTLLVMLPCRRARSAGDSGGVRFVGSVGLLVNALSAVAIAAEWVPVLILDPCLP